MRSIRLFLTLFLATAFSALSAQIAGHDYMVSFFGDTLSGGCLGYRAPILKTPYFELDGTRFPIAEVSAFRNKHGVFFNTSGIHQKDGFALRIVHAPISVLEEIDLDLYGQSELPNNLTRSEERKVLANGAMDYLLDREGNLVEANARGLRTMVSSSSEALNHVQRHRMYKWLRGTLIASGCGVASAGVAQSVRGTGTGISPLLIVGVIGAAANFALAPAIDDARWMAIETYNRQNR